MGLKPGSAVYQATYLAFLEASGRSIFTATSRGRPFLTLKGNSKFVRSWGFSISHRCTFCQRNADIVEATSIFHLLSHMHRYKSGHSSPLQTALPLVSPWRSGTRVAALGVGQRPLQDLRRPRQEQRRCCSHWRPAGLRCLLQRNEEHWEAVGETRGETVMGKEGSQGMGVAPHELEGKPSPYPHPSRRL